MRKTAEQVQKRTARFIKNYYNWENSATSMVSELNLQPLEERRAHTKVTTFFKAISGDLEIPIKHLEPLNLTTRGHQRRYRIPDTRLNITKASFYPEPYASGIASLPPQQWQRLFKASSLP